MNACGAWAGALIVVGAGCSRAEPPAPAGLVDVARSLGIVHATYSGGSAKIRIRESLGQGVAWIDFDRDGDLDLLVLNGGRVFRAEYAGCEDLLEPWRFYVNSGGRFVEAARDVGLDVRAWAIGCAVGDVDGDGFADIFVTTATGPNRLFRNRGDGTFEDRTQVSGLGSRLFCTGAAFGDLDADGDLDLVVATYLDESRPPADGCTWKGAPVMCGPKGFPALDDLMYVNDGTGRFTETTALAGYAGYGLGVLLFDADADLDTDVFIANDSSPNRLFLNHGDGRFEEVGLQAGVALSHTGSSQASMGVDAGDLDADGRPDLVVTNFSDDVHNFYRNDGGGFFSEWSSRSGLGAASFTRLGWSVLLDDFDLDGDLDVFLVNGHVYPQVDAVDPNTSYRQPMQLLFNDGAGGLREHPERVGPVLDEPICGRGCAAADFDGDGDLDLAVTRDGEPPLLLRNNLPAPDAHWLRVRLEGRTVNREGIGALVEIEAGGRRQVREMRRNRGYLSAGPATLVFGLGPVARVDRLVVTWPGGGRQTLTDCPVDREVLIREELSIRQLTSHTSELPRSQ